MDYLGKYCTKAEVKTMTYMELVKQLLPFIKSDKSLLSLVSKTINKLIRERDWSSQEVMHILLSIPLQQGSCEVITLDCRPNQDNQAIQFDEDGEIILKSSSKLQKYLNRPRELENLTLFIYLTQYNWAKYTERP